MLEDMAAKDALRKNGALQKGAFSLLSLFDLTGATKDIQVGGLP